MDTTGDTPFPALVRQCAPQVHPQTAQAIVAVESGFNPWAIGVVGGRLVRQPTHRLQAIATARMLMQQGWDFSVGLGQINVRNFDRLGLTLDSAFDACSNLRALQTVLRDCFHRAEQAGASGPAALRQAVSCYYSGNFVTGFAHGYVQRVVAAAQSSLPPPITKEQP